MQRLQTISHPPEFSPIDTNAIIDPSDASHASVATNGPNNTRLTHMYMHVHARKHTQTTVQRNETSPNTLERQQTAQQCDAHRRQIGPRAVFTCERAERSDVCFAHLHECYRSDLSVISHAGSKPCQDGRTMEQLI